MSSPRFLYCRDCNAVHHVTPFDTAPCYELDGVTIRESPRDDRAQFMEQHSGHRVGELTSVVERLLEGGQSVDPMNVAYMEATDGRESFVLRSFRRSIADPLSYEVCEFVDDAGATKNNPGAVGGAGQHETGKFAGQWQPAFTILRNRKEPLSITEGLARGHAQV